MLKPIARFLVVIAFSSAAFTLFYIYHSPPQNQAHITTHDVNLDLVKPKNISVVPNPNRWCKDNECLVGRWKQRDPPFRSFKDFEQVYANPNDKLWDSGRYNPTPGTEHWTDEQKAEAGQKRLVDILGWIWVPDVGKMRKWDAEEFVIRLLKSPGGLILLGDSITGQHFTTVRYLLDQADIQTDGRLPHLPMYDHKNVHQWNLKKNHPKTLELLARTGVPESRLERPIVTLLEEHMLIGQREIREITGRLGAPKDDYPWTHNFQRVPGWEEFVANASMPREGEEESVTEDTVLLMNAGAHWSRHEFSMFPDRATDKGEQDRIRETFRQMANRISLRLSPIARLSIFYRSTSPGHPNCQTHSSPYPDASAATAAEANVVAHLISPPSFPSSPTPQEPLSDDLKRQKKRWDWDLFAQHNAIWEATIRRLEREPREFGLWEGVVKETGAKWVYMDLWDQALQRGDAHSEPGVDCLHWCKPAVLNEWTFALHHFLFLDSLEKETAEKQRSGKEGGAGNVAYEMD